jgi:serine kinase of HPr protein (carbohydrate metabolism regulator)
MGWAAHASWSACREPGRADVAADAIHATSVAIRGRAVLIEGASGAGKSDLALRLIDRGATLISDDYTVLARSGAQLLATAPATIAGRMEVRGLGIVEVPSVADVPVALVIRLSDEIERMPDPEIRSIEGVDVPVAALDPRPASAPLKVELALHQAEAMTW